MHSHECTSLCSKRSLQIRVRGRARAQVGIMSFDLALGMVSPTDQHRKRWKADKDIGTDDLINLLEEWMHRKGSRDMSRLLRCLEIISWRTRPKASELFPIIDLLQSLLSLTSVPLLHQRKLKNALTMMHDNCPINFSRIPIDLWADKTASKLRCALRKLLDLHQDPEQYRRFMNGCAADQRDTFLEVLDKIKPMAQELQPLQNMNPDSSPEAPPQKCINLLDPDSSPVAPRTPQQKCTNLLDPADFDLLKSIAEAQSPPQRENATAASPARYRIDKKSPVRQSPSDASCFSLLSPSPKRNKAQHQFELYKIFPLVCP